MRFIYYNKIQDYIKKKEGSENKEIKKKIETKKKEVIITNNKI